MKYEYKNVCRLNFKNRISNSSAVRKINQAKTSKREWMCFHCKKANLSNHQDFVYPTIDGVYDHWKSHHSSGNGDIDAVEQQPFRFYLVDVLYCNVESCRYYSTLQRLYTHHQKIHPEHLFVAVQNGRCAMCLYTGDDLNEHSCDSLRIGMQLKLYNPVLLTDKDLAELQAMDCKHSRQQQIECQYCGSTFITIQEINQHHYQQHGYDILFDPFVR